MVNNGKSYQTSSLVINNESLVVCMGVRDVVEEGGMGQGFRQLK